jgi:hypothetical protein
MIVILPTAMTLATLALTLGVFQQHLRAEPCDADTLRFVRGLGLLNVLLVNVVAATFVLLDLGLDTTTVITSVAYGLIATTSVSTLRFDADARAD